MSDFPERIWAWGGCFPDFIESDRDCGEWQDDITESPTNPDDAVEYIRARIAEQREAELVALLEVAQCPQCNGSGIVQEGNGSIYECQWHHERKVLLAKHKAEGREGS